MSARSVKAIESVVGPVVVFIVLAAGGLDGLPGGVLPGREVETVTKYLSPAAWAAVLSFRRNRVSSAVPSDGIKPTGACRASVPRCGVLGRVACCRLKTQSAVGRPVRPEVTGAKWHYSSSSADGQISDIFRAEMSST